MPLDLIAFKLGCFSQIPCTDSPSPLSTSLPTDVTPSLTGRSVVVWLFKDEPPRRTGRTRFLITISNHNMALLRRRTAFAPACAEGPSPPGQWGCSGCSGVVVAHRKRKHLKGYNFIDFRFGVAGVLKTVGAVRWARNRRQRWTRSARRSRSAMGSISSCTPVLDAFFKLWTRKSEVCEYTFLPARLGLH